MTGQDLFTFGVLVALVLGIRSSLRLTRRYVAARVMLAGRERAVLRAFVIVAWSITAAAAYFALVALRRIIGADPIAWSPTTSAVVASLILFLPVFLDVTVDRVATAKDED